MDALERGHVDHAAGLADEDGARHGELGLRPEAAALDGLGAPGGALAAFEDRLELRVLLDGLEHVVRRDGRVGRRQRDDDADRDLVVAVRVDPAADAGLVPLAVGAAGPTEEVDDGVPLLLGLPDFLGAELPDGRLRALGEVEVLDGGTGEVAPVALGEDGLAGVDFHAGLEVAELLAFLAAALVAGDDALDGAVLDEQLGGCGLGEDVGAGLLGLLGHPAAELADRGDPVALVLEVRRRRARHRAGALLREPPDVVLLVDVADGGERLEVLVGEELLERARLHHRAGQVVRAARLALLDDGDGDLAELLEQLLVFGEELQEAVGCGQTGRPTTDDRDADLDGLVLAGLGGGDELGRSGRPAAGTLPERVRWWWRPWSGP